MDASPSGESRIVSDHLQIATTELREVVRQIECEDIDSRVVRDFRNAVDHIRTTAEAVQQWFELKEKQADPYIVLPTLARERVRRTALLARDLNLDLDTMEVGIETAGLDVLYHSVDGLNKRLANIFNRR
jgi:hypothetical protein